MKRPQSRVYILLVLTVIMIMASAIVTYFSTYEKKQSQKMVLQTYNIIHSAERLFSFMKDIETSQRGYIITSDSAFLELYKDDLASLVKETATLRSLVSDNRQETSLLTNKILPVIKNKSGVIEQGILIHNKFGRDSANVWVARKIGKAHMDTLRILFSNFIQNERALLARHSKTLATNSTIEDTIQFSSFTLVALTCTISFIRLRKEKQKVDDLFKKLEMANEQLEHKVAERTRQLTEANRDKDHFLGIASHDLKAPLSGVLRLVELMKLERNTLSPRHLEYLNYVEDSCNEMEHLISDLLDINRIERKETRLTMKATDLHALMNKLEQHFAGHAKKKNIHLEIDKIDATIKTDPGLLLQVLENLLSNALKFSPPDKQVQVKVCSENRHILFKVIDEGPGIPDSEMPLLFKKFSRLSNKPTGGESSSGLGLSIANELTHLLSGTISVSSSAEKGTTFSVTIPC